ncbi:MAG: pyridine nucleotide transhydrogenase [Planctomycetota bacterium]
MARALIGHTGFVGGNLVEQAGGFTDCYNSKNVEDLAGRSFELVVCAGAPAVKWKANQEPDADRASLARLRHALERVRAEELILISTVDVFPEPIGVDEASPLSRESGQPYGLHRLWLEDFVRERFGRTTIVRLPALFGRGLKKNAIYDLLHGHRVEAIHPDGAFQFYDLDRLWADIERARGAGLDLVHFATEPLVIRDLAREIFGVELANDFPAPAPRYDFHTRHASVFGARGAYAYDAETVRGDLARFVAAERARLAQEDPS